jgi:hypothetical protein
VWLNAIFPAPTFPTGVHIGLDARELDAPISNATRSDGERARILLKK